MLRENPMALGFSLRLGIDTVFCHPQNKSQKVPAFQKEEDSVLGYSWPSADGDFGYPFDLSSSIYRLQDVYSIMIRSYFPNPNILEHELDRRKSRFRHKRDSMLCFKKSAAFCNPINRVQNNVLNRCGNLPENSVDHLVDLFLQGRRIDVSTYQGLEVTACHQEVSLKLIDGKANQVSRG
jgi:hypothetical protein